MSCLEMEGHCRYRVIVAMICAEMQKHYLIFPVTFTEMEHHRLTFPVICAGTVIIPMTCAEMGKHYLIIRVTFTEMESHHLTFPVTFAEMESHHLAFPVTCAKTLVSGSRHPPARSLGTPPPLLHLSCLQEYSGLRVYSTDNALYRASTFND